jgi:hypothetical protein
MKLAVLALVLVTACRASPGDGPPRGGGDAGTEGDDGGAGIAVSGRVCLLSDLRHPTLCDDQQDAQGVKVSLGTRSTTTTDKAGSFSIIAPLGAGFTWHVTGDVLDRIVTSAMPFGTDPTIPVISTQLYRDLLSTNKAEILSQQGSIVVRVVSGVTPAPNVSATSTVAGSLTLYDSNNSALDWNESPSGSTGAGGIVWFPGVPLSVHPPTVATITLIAQSGTPVSVTTMATVEDQVITFVTQDIQ